MKEFKSLLQFQKHFDTDEKCRAYLEEQRWNGVPCCPHCGSTKVYRLKNGKQFNCGQKGCKQLFTVTVGTYYENTKIPLTKWFIAMYIIGNHSKGISSLQLAGFIDTTQTTAWFLLHRIRRMMGEESTEQLKNTVEVDETFVGGKRSNKHAWKRRELNERYGPGSDEKTPVIGFLEREGKLVTHKVAKTDGATLRPIVKAMIEEGSKLMTDGSGAYTGLNKHYEHGIVNHDKGEYAVGDVHVNSIEGYWGFFKRCIFGIYHFVSPKHLDAYCDEIAHRWNERKLAQDEKFKNILGRCDGRLKFKDLTNNEVPETPAAPEPSKDEVAFKSMRDYKKYKQ